MKKKVILCSILIVSSFIFANADSLVLTYPIFAIGKYVCTIFAISYTMKVVLEVLHVRKLKNMYAKRICSILTIILLLCYCILTIDTFLFHVLTWYPGILRYVVFDAYGVLYLVFLFLGLLWYLGSED